MTEATIGKDLFTEIDQAFEIHKKTAAAIRHTTAAERIAKLDKLKDALLAHKTEILAAAHSDFRKPEVEVFLAEVMPILSEIKHTKSHLKKWMKNKKVMPTMTMIGTQSHIRHEPKGTSLIIAPWNYPFNLSFAPLVSAIAAGCTAIIKPSEMTPEMTKVIKQIVESAFSQDEVVVIEGEVPETTHLLSKPFDHIFFTGSPMIGKVVMAAASKHLTSVTLELGGKSPVFIDSSANLKKAARKILWGKYTNNGQTCIAPDYILVEEGIKAAFLHEMKTALVDIYGATASEQKNSPDLARIVNERHYSRLKAVLDDAISKGAEIIAGGDFDESQNYIQPTILGNIDSEARILEEEIFGPLLPIITYKNVDEALDFVNARPKPLALYVYAEDNQYIEKVMSNTSAGGSCVNHSLLHFIHDNLPAGGVNNSGIGKAHGHAGFLAFSNDRGVVRDRFSSISMLFPPYTPKVKKLANMAIKILS